MNQPHLTQELEDALDKGHGFVQGPSYVLMSRELFRDIMGVDSDEEMASALKAIGEGLDDIDTGRTKSMDQVFRELDEKYYGSDR
jgi:predicted transcriptional regulator